MVNKNYHVVTDQGGYIGLHCLECGKGVWKEEFSTINLTTGKECANCNLIKSKQLLIKEQQNHAKRPKKCENDES